MLLQLLSLLFALNAHGEDVTLQPLAFQDAPATSSAASISREPVCDTDEQRHGVQLRINSDQSGELQNEEQCWISPLDSNLRCAVWRDFRLGFRQIGIGVSTDGGQTWEDRLLPFADQLFTWQSDPDLAWNRDGTLYLTTLDFTQGAGNTLTLYASDDAGQTFTYRGNTGIAHESEFFDDKQLLCCDRSGTDSDGVLHMTWSRFDYTGEFTTNYILHSRSLDEGETWSEPQLLSSESVQWSVPMVGASGEVYVGWVDYSTSSIRWALSTDAGETFADQQLLRGVTQVQANLNGEIRSYSFPAWEADLGHGPNRGRVHLCYMDQSSGDADLWYSHSDDMGTSWSEDIRLNSDEWANGLDQFHPWMSVDDEGAVHVIWYDRRHDPDNYLIDLYYRCSVDGGESWGPEIRITDSGFDPRAGTDRAGLLGEYLGLATGGGQVQLAFTDTRLGDQDVWGAAFPRPQAPVVTPCGPPCGPVEDTQAFLAELAAGNVGLTISDHDGGEMTISWFAGWMFWSETVALVPGDTLVCHPSIANLEDFTEDELVLYYTVHDGLHVVNPMGEDCAWELDLTSIDGVPVQPGSLQLDAWPNPFNPLLNISLEGGLGPGYLRIHDLQGRLVMQHDLQTSVDQHLQWDASGMASGVYLLAVLRGEHMLHQKVLLLR